VRAAGVSNFDVALLARCEAMRHVDSLQPPFSMIRREAAARQIPWCFEHGTGVIGYSPMQSGLLTESFGADRVAKFAADDWRRRSPEYQPPRLERNLALRDALKPIARRHGTTVATAAIAWTLAWHGVTGAIVGARSAAQVESWIGAATLKLTAADLDAIAAAIARTGAGGGPARPASVPDAIAS
jgi:aryl-alcohol dehydrogenase-like predicted oxidoreductase